MSRLDAAKFCNLDFIINFGVPPAVKTKMAELVDSGTKSGVFAFLETLEPKQLLIIYRYFSWADKKIHSVFFVENKDEISEDLLEDFRHEDEGTKFKKAEHLGKKKIAKVPEEAKKEVKKVIST